MSWQQILQDDIRSNAPLRQRIDTLFDEQRATWPALRDGEAALANLQRKTLTSNCDSVIVQLNPGRRRSTLAKTDAQAVAARACFLCPANMPAEERGVAIEDLVVLPNPYPILPLHCTIADRDHRPQQLAGRIDTFLRLAAQIGPDLAALYNGPRCGASAPDHFHFQAARADVIPIIAQLPALVGERPIAALSSFGRNMLIFSSENAAEIQANIERSIDAIREIEAATEEPMFNLLAHFEAGRYAAVFFSRARHRPSCYFRTGPDQLSISPAILEMCGILVVTEPDHFAQIGPNTVREVYQEVSIAPERFNELVAQVAPSPTGRGQG